MRYRETLIPLFLGMLALLGGCRPQVPSERARILGLHSDDPVELAVAGSKLASGLVVVYWPKLGACQACAVNVKEGIAEFVGHASNVSFFEVWPKAVAMPEILRVDLAAQVVLDRDEYVRQVRTAGTPRLEAWRSGRLVLLQTLDERRANADFVEQVLDHCLGAT